MLAPKLSLRLHFSLNDVADAELLSSLPDSITSSQPSQTVSTNGSSNSTIIVVPAVMSLVFILVLAVLMASIAVLILRKKQCGKKRR